MQYSQKSLRFYTSSFSQTYIAKLSEIRRQFLLLCNSKNRAKFQAHYLSSTKREKAHENEKMVAVRLIYQQKKNYKHDSWHKFGKNVMNV